MAVLFLLLLPSLDLLLLIRGDTHSRRMPTMLQLITWSLQF